MLNSPEMTGGGVDGGGGEPPREKKIKTAHKLMTTWYDFNIALILLYLK